MVATTGLFNAGAMQAMAQQKDHQAKGADATAQLASGRAGVRASYKPANEAMASSMESMTKVIDQAKLNASNLKSVIQLGAKTLQNMRNTLSSMDQLAAQASAGELTTSDRAQIHAVMSKLREGLQTAASTTEFNGKKLFNGGAAGTVSINANLIGAAGATVAVTNAFVAGITTAAGFIGGEVKSATVTANGANYDFSVVVGDQTFRALNQAIANNGVMTLISESNPLNHFEITQAAAATAITTVATAQTAWNSALGLVPGADPAEFVSLSTAAGNQIANGGSSSTTTIPGRYAVVATGNAAGAAWSLMDSTGRVIDTATSTAAVGAKSIAFAQAGITLTTAAGYDPAVASAQLVFDVAAGGSVSITSQTGAYSNVTTTVDFAAATTDLLGTPALKLSNISLSSVANASLASDAIKAAMAQISTMYGNLGAAMGNLELQEKVLSDTSAELQSAISGIRDADIPAAITQQKIMEVMAELANIAQGKALQQSQQLLKLAQQA